MKIIFTKVVTNIVNGYNSTTGIFTVSRNGTYMFTVVSHVTSGYHWVRLTVNGKHLSVTHGQGNYDTGKGRTRACYRPQRSCEGYVFTPVYLSTGGVCLVPGGAWSWRGAWSRGVPGPREVSAPGGYLVPG